MKVHDSFNDFVLFLYVHMALSDGTLDPSEELVILDRLTKLYPQEGNPKKKLDQAVIAYNKVEKSTIDEIIHHSFKHFHTVKFAQRYKIYTDMFDIMHADGRVADSEQEALDTLKKIIDLAVPEQ